MARFMIVTFLLLGWGFFELSGGNDFTPREPEPKPLNALLEEVAQEEERTLVARADQAPASAEIIGQAPDREERAQVTLAGFGNSTPSLATLLGDAEQKLEPVVPVEEVAAAIDLRAVNGNRVNMRNGPGTNYQVLDKLVRGDEAEVLQEPGNGWVKIRVISSGRIGWMASRLLTPVN